MKIVFMGTPEFSATVLYKLCESGNIPTLVVTRADKPAGRGYELKPSAVKRLALEKNIEVLQPEKLSDENFISRLRAISPDVIIVVAYGKILPEAILKLPKYGCINAHASLLPKYRGAAPMQRAIINGETETGVSIMKMDKGLDTGDVLLSLKTEISITDTLETIHDRLAELSGDALLQALEKLETNSAVFTPQNNSNATYAEKILKKDEKIDFSLSAELVSCKIRALTPFPFAYCMFENKMLKIIEAYTENAETVNNSNGEILSVKNGKIKVACGKNVLVITKVFPESKRKMSALDFVNGSKIKVGDILN